MGGIKKEKTIWCRQIDMLQHELRMCHRHVLPSVNVLKNTIALYRNCIKD
jgi:hypothetical protein